MPRFRKKPVEVEAVTVDDALRAAQHAWGDLPPWLAEAYERGDVLFLSGEVFIKTLEGNMTGQRGDWIIHGVQGELYPIKDSIFRETYEAVGAA